MPQRTGERFSSRNLLDCAFCPPDGRQFRTTRQCAACSRPLCLVCRPWSPRLPFLCPDCGGGPPESAFTDPEAAIRRIEAAGHAAPYWLIVLRERIAVTAEAEEPIPE